MTDSPDPKPEKVPPMTTEEWVAREMATMPEFSDRQWRKFWRAVGFDYGPSDN